MRRASVSIVLALALAACSDTPTVPSADIDGFVGYLDERVPGLLAEHRVPGAAIALVQDGRFAWSGAYGRRVEDGDERLRADDAFQVGSLAKSVAAYAITALAERGMIELDAPVLDHIDGWSPPSDGPDGGDITMRMLLSHTAGLSTEGYPGIDPDAPLPTLPESLAGASGATPVRLVDVPGRTHRYSGGGYTVAQLVVEEATGEPFAEVVAREVFAPLGMVGSTYAQRPPAVAAAPHDAAGERLPWFAYAELAAAGLVSTAPDLARFLADGILAPTAAAPVSKAGVAELLRPAAATDGTYGLGFFLERVGEDVEVVGHAGSSRGWRAKMLALPTERAAIVILTNGDGGTPLHVEVGCTWLAAQAGLAHAREACP